MELALQNTHTLITVMAQSLLPLFRFLSCSQLLYNNVIASDCVHIGAVGSDVGQINEVTTEMGDRIGVQLLVREIYLSLTNHPGQLSLAIPPG